MVSLALLVLRHTPQSLGQVPDPPAGRAAGAPQAPSLPPGRAIWREARSVRLCTGFSLGAAALVGLLAHLFSLLAPTLGAFGAGLALSLITIYAVIGRTLLGWALPVGADRRRAGAWNFTLQMCGTLILLMALDVSAPLLLFGCVVVGLTVGNMLSLPPMIAQAEFTRADVGRVVALVTAVNQATYALTPGGFGLLRDLTGSGAAVLVAAALLQAASAVILFRR